MSTIRRAARSSLAPTMPDRLTAAERSAHMARIRGKHTQPELRVRRLLHAMGYRFRLHRRDLPGSPDVALPRLRALIHVRGCFWHQHPSCRLARLPKSRPDYWLPKLERNVARDEEAIAGATRLGWRPLVVWECETANSDVLEHRLRAWLTGLAAPVPGSGDRAAAGRRVRS